MKTITFYSYKGGTGRSLAAANLAMALYRIGVSACLLDFDLEGPGLHYKLDGHLSFNAKGFKCGIAHLIMRSLIDEGRLTEEELADFGIGLDELPPGLRSGKGVEGITGIAKKLQAKDDRRRNKRALWFIPAGQIDSLNYWRIVMHPMFGSRVDLRMDEDQAFFNSVVEGIASVEPAPEYLIVDSRSGVNELSGVSTRLLANAHKVVILTVNHPEGIKGSGLIIGELGKAVRDKRRNEKVLAPEETYLVASRIPDDPQSAQRVYWQMAEEIYGEHVEELGLNVQWLPHQDELSEKEELFIPAEGNIKGLSLTERYLKLFAQVLPEHGRELHELEPGYKRKRVFALVQKEGRLINPDDNTPNVAFRTTTYVRGLESTYNVMKEAAIARGMSKKEAEDVADEALFKAGRDAAGGTEGFGEYAGTFRETPNGTRLAEGEAIRRWCKFDSRVGFGSFNSTVLEGGKGQIQLTDSFLTRDRDKKQTNLCSFMTGYIATILSAIYDGKVVDVTHDRDSDCSQFTRSDPPVCRFNYVVQA
jgi:predicted hydrocarbon binding protein